MKRWLGVACAVAVLMWPAIAPANKLVDIYRLAKQKDAQFEAAQAAYRAGREAWPQARAAALPSLAATATYSDVEREVEATPFSGGGGSGPAAPFTDDFTSKSYGVELRQPLFNWGIPATLRQGRARVNIAELEYLDAKQSLLARVLSGYIEFLKAQAALDLTQAEKKAIAADLERTEGRYEVGEISVTALQEAQAALDLAESRIISARADLDRQREALRRLTTRWYQSLPDVPRGFDPDMPQPARIEAWVQRTFEYKPEYLVAVREAGIAEDRIERQRSDYIPDLDLVAGYRDTDDTEFVFGGASNDTTVALEATWQLFAGGRNLSEVRESKARYDQTQAEVISASRRLAGDTRNAYRRVATELRRLDALDKAVASARTAFKSVKAEFDVGERTQADVIDARRDLYSALIDRAQSRYDFATAATQLRLAAGVLSEQDLERVDALLVAPGQSTQKPVPVPE